MDNPLNIKTLKKNNTNQSSILYTKLLQFSGGDWGGLFDLILGSRWS